MDVARSKKTATVLVLVVFAMCFIFLIFYCVIKLYIVLHTEICVLYTINPDANIQIIFYTAINF